MERMMVVQGVEAEEEDGLPFLLKGWRDSCLVMASITEAGTFTGNRSQNIRCWLRWYLMVSGK